MLRTMILAAVAVAPAAVGVSYAAKWQLVIPPNEACAEYRIVKRSDGAYVAACAIPIPCTSQRFGYEHRP